MGSNISVYLSDAALAKLDAAVARKADQDRALGLSGRKVASRSGIIEQLICEKLEGNAPLDQATISYFATKLGKERGAKKILLFGSYARGDATAESDVDILLDKGRIRGMEVLDFQEELSECLGKPVDVVTTAGASERFLDKIGSYAVVLYEA